MFNSLRTFTLSIALLIAGATSALAESVNFQPDASPVPEGYVKDNGAAFDGIRGWIRADYNQPLNLGVTGRDRNKVADQARDTHISMQALTGPSGYWEATVPNGRYDVTVTVGDPSFFDSNHVINVESENVISEFVGTTAAPFATFAKAVDVVDGRLTIDAFGGTNTKIASVIFNRIGEASTTVARPNLFSYTTDGGIMPDRLMFSTVNSQVRGGKNLELKNVGTSPLTVTSITIEDSIERFNGGRAEDYTRTADFLIESGGTAPFVLQPGQSHYVKVAFRPQRDSVFGGYSTYTTNGENYASLLVRTEGAKFPTKRIALAGFNADNYEDRFEPALQETTRIFGWKVNVGSEKLVIGNGAAPRGDEVLSPYFEKIGDSVNLFPLAVLSGRSNTPHGRVSWYKKDMTYTAHLYEFAGRNNDFNAPGSNDESGGENQKLLPFIFKGGVNQIYTYTNTRFTPSTAFGIRVGTSYTDDNLNEGKFHNWRIYPAKDAFGNLQPGGLYIAAQDLGGVSATFKNYDFNDQVFLLRGVRPAQ